MKGFIILLGIAIGIAGITAFGISMLLKYCIGEPMFYIGLSIGSVVSTIVTVKIRNHRDDILVKKYLRRKAREQEKLKTAKQAEKKAEPVKEPENEDGEFTDTDLFNALIGMGYTKSEVKEAIEYIKENHAQEPFNQKIILSAQYLSTGKVRR